MRSTFLSGLLSFSPVFRIQAIYDGFLSQQNNKSTITWLALNPLNLQNILDKQHNVQCSLFSPSWFLTDIRKAPATEIKIQNIWSFLWICNCFHPTIKWSSHKSNYVKWGGQSVVISLYAWEVTFEPAQCWVLLRKQVQTLPMAKPFLSVTFA